MKIKPLGFYVLIEMIKVEETSAGGIILNRDDVSKQQEATDVGYVRAIGPTAFAGYPGCETELMDKEGVMRPIPALKPYDKWGLEIGQKIEYRRFEGKRSAVPGCEDYRYIPDSHIIGAIDDE